MDNIIESKCVYYVLYSNSTNKIMYIENLRVGNVWKIEFSVMPTHDEERFFDFRVLSTAGRHHHRWKSHSRPYRFGGGGVGVSAERIL